jgi:putative phosphoesterase
MKIGVISDTHIPFAGEDLPDKIYQDFKNVDLILHAGDIVEESLLEKLNKLAKTIAVKGNMDSHSLKKKLPVKQIIKVKKFKIGLTHGEGTPQGLVDLVKKQFEKDKVDCIVFGHSHAPLCEKRGNMLFLNPGSPTDQIFSPFNSYGILEIDDKIEGKIVRIN